MATRREFLRLAFAAGVVRSAYGHAANRKLKLGLIGAGRQGLAARDAAYKAGNVEWTAISDVDSARLLRVAAQCEKAQGTRPKILTDYRELLDVPGLDAVVIATPPHWHAPPFVAACAKGLAIYQETPFGYDVPEGRAMVRAWRAAGNIVQAGFQSRQEGSFRELRDLIRSGQAGRIVQAEARLYRRAAIPRGGWRLEKEYGNGILVEEGIHLLDRLRSILEEREPNAVTASGGIYRLQGKITTPDTFTAHFEFAQIPVVWRHQLWEDAADSPHARNGIVFYGTRVTVFAADNPSRMRTAGAKHMAEFLDCVRAGKQPSCTPDDAFRSAATVHLAMASYAAGKRVSWDNGPFMDAADYRV